MEGDLFVLYYIHKCPFCRNFNCLAKTTYPITGGQEAEVVHFFYPDESDSDDDIEFTEQFGDATDDEILRQIL